MPIPISEYSIEHIMPQNKNLSTEWQQELGSNWQEIQARYLHTIGNLTLTGSAYNSSMRDRPFGQKRQVNFGLTQSGLQLNDSLIKLEHWNVQEIETRAQMLASMAIKIWTMPNLTTEQVQQYGRRVQKAPLVEVVGPVDHPLAGFIPAGYRILPANEKRFYYHRLLNGEWIPYGNGRDAWYANSWERVGKTIREFARKNEKPLGVGGEIDPRYSRKAGYEQGDQNGDDPNDKTVYTIDSYPYLQGAMYTLFESLRKHILNLDPSVREEYKKLYIAYKTTTNFVDIAPHKSFLKLTLNMAFNEIDDPKGLCKDVTTIGHHGNGDIEVHLSSFDQLDDAMDLIQQAFMEHWEKGIV